MCSAPEVYAVVTRNPQSIRTPHSEVVSTRGFSNVVRPLEPVSDPVEAVTPSRRLAARITLFAHAITAIEAGLFSSVSVYSHYRSSIPPYFTCSGSLLGGVSLPTQVRDLDAPFIFTTNRQACSWMKCCV